MSIDTVNDLEPRVQYVAAAAQTDFDYPFPIFADADLLVYVDGVLKTLTTHYTVAGEGNDAGGTITFVTPMTGAEVVTILREIAIERLTDFQQNGPWQSSSYNDEQDRTYLILQELKSSIKRALRLPNTTEVDTDDLELPLANWASKYLTFDADGVPTPAALSAETMTQATIGGLLYPQTAAEITAGVTPTNYAYPAGHAFRYGAVGDGSTDDNTAIANAISTGHDLTGPSWDEGYIFAITGNISGFADHQKITGLRFKKKGATVQPMFLLPDNSDGVWFDGCEFDGNRSLFSFGNAATAILGYLTFSLKVTDCYFHDIIDAGIKLRDGARLHAEGNRFYYIAENGIEINNYVNDARTGSPYVGTRPTVEGWHRIVGNHFERITRLEDGGTGIVDACGVIFNSVNASYPVDGVTITGNTFVDCLRHIWTENNTAGTEAKNITVTGNTFRGAVYGAGANSYGKAGIGFIGVKGGVIANNVLRNIGNYDAVGSDTSGITLSASYGTTTNERVTVANNTIIDDTGDSLRTKYGITLTVGTLCKVYGNQISGMRTAPMSIGANFTISSIYGNPGASDEYSWGQIVSLVFSKQNVPANTATIDTVPFGYADDNEIVIPCAGTLVGLSAKLNTAVTAGNITITPYSNGTARSNLEITLADFSSNIATKRIAASSGVAVAAGSRFKVNIATDASFLPTTLDAQITLFIDIGAKV